MANFLKFLTNEDRKSLLEKATLQAFDADQVIVNQGEKQKSIFVLAKGEARVEKSHGEFSVEVSRITAGEIFGEMGFVEGFEASANIIADEPCKVYVIGTDVVAGMIKSNPGFYGRFFQSLAHTLSKRLRETTVDGISDFSWGSRGFGGETEPVEEEPPGWGGGSPFDDESVK